MRDKPRDIALRYIKSDEVQKLLSAYPEKIRQDFETNLYKKVFFTEITKRPTPLEFIETRKGAKDRETGLNVLLEYFKEEYTITELDEIFAGWWQEDMNYTESQKYLTGRVSGYLCVQYPTPTGLEVTKRWAVASAKQDITETGGVIKYMNPDDLEKKALTEWYKIAGKRYGIGFDLYHQKITNAHRDMFLDMVEDWGEYGEEHRQQARLFETGMSFRRFLKNMPTKDQTSKFINLLKMIPGEYQDRQKMLDFLWKGIDSEGKKKGFIYLSNNTHQDTLNTENWLIQIKNNLNSKFHS